MSYLLATHSLDSTAVVSRSVPGVGPVASAMFIAKMPELGQVTGEQATVRAGLAPIAHVSRATRGKLAIAGGRRWLRYSMFEADLVASRNNSILKSFANRVRAARKPNKAATIGVARKLMRFVNALIKLGQK